MLEGLPLFLRLYLIETVQIQLTYKGCEIAMFKKLGKYLLSELCDIFDDKCCSVSCPMDYIAMLGILYIG